MMVFKRNQKLIDGFGADIFVRKIAGNDVVVGKKSLGFSFWK